MPKSSDPTEDGINRAELLFYANDVDPIVAGDENSLEEVFSEKLTVEPARLESDARAHYVMNRIVGTKPEECPTALCLASVMPGASMTGVPKKPVNSWLKKTEPARRNAYTGAIGYIGPKNRVQFNTAVRTMVTKGSIAYVHAGQSISEETNPEEAFHLSKSNVSQMFEDIKSLGKAFYP
jgi:para-aminobenzoate synthetase component 1